MTAVLRQAYLGRGGLGRRTNGESSRPDGLLGILGKAVDNSGPISH